MISRRYFIKSAAVSGAAVLLNPYKSLRGYGLAADYIGLHPFIELNPDAVFVMRTNVDNKKNSGAKKQVGLDFGRSVFKLVDDEKSGYPLDYNIALKPNLTCRGKWDKNYTVEGSMGVVTDAYFVEGLINSIKELGVAGEKFFIREVNCPEDFADGGYDGVAERTGAELRDMSARMDVLEQTENSVQWVDVPDGVWFRKIPYLWPINAPKSWLLNISKFKTHAMGVTLCAKNLQGTIVHNYQAHCTEYHRSMDMLSSHINPTAKTDIKNNYNRHVADEIPRWDRPGNDGGIWMETWASRCLDNNSVTKPALHIVEGVCGRDGHFIAGPGPGELATDYMTNIIIFGKNQFYVDIIGHWLAGHEPGNFGLFHLAIERGLSDVLNPFDIPVYEWKADGSAVLTPLGDFKRTLLKTMYLQKDYNGFDEPYWHLCNEPYEYKTTIAEKVQPQKPESFVLNQNFPNPFNASTSITFYIPQSGHVRLDICNEYGQVVDRLADAYYVRGSHLLIWNTRNAATGVYYYRFDFGGEYQTGKMLLLR
ncbi:DUF362 domain-containing protein [candidate division KSB1 bacterium]|nr:DUF362 domain-containing protein [candidate division KSB1 bacterium]